MQQQPQQKFISNIILKHKIKSMCKVWRKRAKNSKQRFYKLRQWSTTQKSYLQKLVLLRDQVKKPLLQSKLINEHQQAIIFPNLESMIQLGQTMETEINNLIASWNPIKTVLAPTVESLVNYLKIYKDYSNNFKKADKIIQQLKHQPNYNSIVKIYNVEDYLIKPVQRPLQYKLFLIDYIKLLPPKHIDKQRLEKTKSTLLKIADQINEFVQKQLRAEKLIQLQNIFGNLIESTREYRSQFSAIHPDFSCKVYVFNDLLLIVKVFSQTKEQKFMQMYLCGGSYVIRQPDNKTFKNRLYICGTYQSIHLTFRCPEDANIAHHTIEELIHTLYKKQCVRTQLLSNLKMKRQTMAMNRHSTHNQYKWKEQCDYRIRLRVQVIGVEKRLYEKQWKFVYAVRIKLAYPQSIYHVVHYEIDELKNIEKYLREAFPKLGFPSLESKLTGMNYDDAKNDFTKYYQFKCILIEDFINFVLRSKELCRRVELIALKLKLYEGIWDYLNKTTLQCLCEACTSMDVITSMEEYRIKQERIRKKQHQFCILNSFFSQNALATGLKPQQFKKLSLQQKLIWVTCKQNRIRYGLQNQGQFGKKLGFHVYINMIGQDSAVFLQNITATDTCRSVVQEACSRKGITESMDFCLVYVHGKHEYYLDQDQYIQNAVAHLEGEFKKFESDKRLSGTNRASIFTTFSRSMDDFGDAFNDFSVPDQPKLYVRKYIYLHSHLEQKACQKHPQRYSVVLAEYLRKFQYQYLLLTIEEIKQFCGLFYGLEEFNTIIFSKNIFCNEEKLKKFLPQSKWNFIGTQFTEKIREVLQNQVKNCSNILILYKYVLKKFADKIGIYTQFFASEISDPAALGIKQKNLLIGVSQHKVTVSRRFNAGTIMEFPIHKITFRISGDCLFIDSQEKIYQFRGNNWLLFGDLVQKYKLIYEMEWSEVKDDK